LRAAPIHSGTPRISLRYSYYTASAWNGQACILGASTLSANS
jgi:hypothetical protein